MPEEKTHISYRNQEGVPVNFERKRLQFWLETVPEDIRRLEYELWKRKRLFFHNRTFGLDHKRSAGRFTIHPPYTKEQEKIDWAAFAESFLIGDERKERFDEIIQDAKKDLPKILEQYAAIIPTEKILIAAVGGSSIYGPRKPGERHSDIDIDFLIDSENDSLNFTINQDQTVKDFGKPYGIIGTGYSDKAKGSFDIHWLLYPHYPLHNALDDERLKSIIANLVEATSQRREQIEKRIGDIDFAIESRRYEQVFE